ncbi:fatty acid desaturase [Zhongshania sp.]|jgi:fatty acid desaturase|uniref:fatty acid desaturase n=1 Tax=Zhongshania sp. TaxID=1971902 RepID=UPI0025DE573D|nr:fatty acid desaturase [Zhongshania sp.]
MMIKQNRIPQSAALTNEEKTAFIRKSVLQAGDELRAKHRWLKHQDAIGAIIMVLSLLGMLGSAWLYYQEIISWWLCIPLVALFASFIHELEHDLIHTIYFRKNPKINRMMLIIGWIARPSTINPLVRRRLHLHHHKHSGTESDLEERGITNGEHWNMKRLIMTGDNKLATKLRTKSIHEAAYAYIVAQKPSDDAELKKLIHEQRNGYFPIGKIYYFVWHGWLILQATLILATLAGISLALPSAVNTAIDILNFLAVTVMLPCFLRTFCLHFISSNMHYYGDVEDGNVMQQTQVLNVWWLFPLQLFCFNFGATHAIHHFAVREPFYIRQWTSKQAHAVMREMGVRFNDIGTFKRANRYTMAANPAVELNTNN